MPEPAGSLDTTVSALVQVANLLLRRLAPLFQKAGVTPQQWAVIGLLASMDSPPTLAGIAREMLVSKQNITGMVSRLEALGLITRAGDASDMRASRVQLTRKGRALHEKVAPAYEQWLESVFRSLDAGDRRVLQRALLLLMQDLESGPAEG